LARSTYPICCTSRTGFGMSAIVCLAEQFIQQLVERDRYARAEHDLFAIVSEQPAEVDAAARRVERCFVDVLSREVSHHRTFPQSAQTLTGVSPGGGRRFNGGCQSCSPASQSVPNR
jgi:hypothetical protein